MPVIRGKDVKGPFYRWGNLTKYYYKPNDKDSREIAKLKAQRQGGAVVSRMRRNLHTR